MRDIKPSMKNKQLSMNEKSRPMFPDKVILIVLTNY